MTNVFSHVRSFLEQQPAPAKTLEKSSSPNILYTALPKHWRSNKSFQEPFYVVLLTPVPDNTEVSIWAGNDEKPCEEVRNEKAKVHRQVAKFNDLRFVGRSGRGEFGDGKPCEKKTSRDKKRVTEKNGFSLFWNDRCLFIG
ncbi:hypothetical protein B9Z55_001124 [Caenorhabditis nigoni]|uniref:Runt domain-containing protein n=1 Tax=Caenorhabditis nigoni TaxID=1611254 RepID=A0A2G5VEQ9_9PELO|nr:hypothetical protein B9Z55_001124 [Caenorhabditis nigoni]